jgi:hypothetical protein
VIKYSRSITGSGGHMYSITLHRAEHVKHYSISPRLREGWIVRLEEDRALVRQTCYRDWHRVERAAAIFRLQVADLMARGWELGRSTT